MALFKSKLYLPDQRDKKGNELYPDEMYQRIQRFNPQLISTSYLQVDVENRLLFISTAKGFKRIKRYYNFRDLIDYELIEDKQSVAKGGVSVGRAVVGGALFGGMGAILGGATGKKKVQETVSSLMIRMSLYDQEYPSLEFHFLLTKEKKGSGIHINAEKRAQEALAAFDFITTTNQRDLTQQQNHFY